MTREGHGMHRVWTEDELDAALADLAAATPVEDDDAVLAGVHARLTGTATDAGHARPAQPAGGDVAALDTPRRRRRPWRRVAVLTAAAVTAVACAVGVTVVGGGDGEPTRASAAERLLTDAAESASAADDAVPPGKYRYVGVRAWYSSEGDVGDGTYFLALVEQRNETWVPADDTGVWHFRSTSSGRYRWLAGSESKAEKAGIVPPDRGVTEEKGRCGDYYPPDGEPSSCANVQVGWNRPRAEWIDGLPRDPERLAERLRGDVESWPDDGSGVTADMFSAATSALESGMLPADLRAALYRVLADLPGIRITERVANLDGRTGVAFSLPSPGLSRRDVILDPKSGEFIGSRSVLAKRHDGGVVQKKKSRDGEPVLPKSYLEMPDGTVLEKTAVRTGVVDDHGVRPPRG
ncbi:MAG: hypothetical protein GEV10_23060 [Streptosporangiales bacterium]|nr:hypothetical protein [Streptosporangiales bacterium]